MFKDPNGNIFEADINYDRFKWNRDFNQKFDPVNVWKVGDIVMLRDVKLCDLRN